ncbi:MAG: DUF3194 domain-containing protein [Candidatus Bathyarchaeota archaeon]|nr:DUF3194 domain-containing protein [Candidatus Bathyarchaeota archaeon]
MQEFGIPELSSEQIEELCLIAEEAARKHIQLKVPLKLIEKLDVVAEVDQTMPVRLTVDVDLQFSPSFKTCDAKKLAEDAVARAFASAENHLRELACQSRK